MRNTSAPAPAARPEDRSLYGIALMLAFCVMAPLLDASAKLATETIPVGQITTARFVVQGVLMGPVVLIMGMSFALDRRLGLLIGLRAVFLILSTYAFVAAVVVMPIADALAIVFVEPFILLFLGRLIFGDQIGPTRLLASITGFLGALLVIQPSLTTFGWVALYPLATAFFFSAYILVTRAMADTLDPVMQQFWTSVAGAVICLPILFLADRTHWPTLDPVWPEGAAWVWLIGVGFWAAASHMCMTMALRHAPAATLAPIHYLELVMAVVIGYLVFGDFPNLLTWVGIAIIAGSGLAVVLAEHRGQALPELPPEI